MSKPFITFYTPTYRRPCGLEQCLLSVRAQTAVEHIEQIVIPDHLGIGIGGMFSRVKDYAPAVHGEYVHLLCDDDILASADVVERVMAFADVNGYPPLIIVRAVKGGAEWPAQPCWPPQLGQIDLSCFITRDDVWRAHAQHYGHRYEGDYDYASALYRSGIQAAFCDVRFVIGGVSRGAAEIAA